MTSSLVLAELIIIFSNFDNYMFIIGSSASSSSYLHSSPSGSGIAAYSSSPINYSPLTPGSSSSISAASPYNNPQTPGSGTKIVLLKRVWL